MKKCQLICLLFFVNFYVFPICSTPSGISQNPIIFIHGLGGKSDNWVNMMNNFIADQWESSTLFAYTFSNRLGVIVTF